MTQINIEEEEVKFNLSYVVCELVAMDESLTGHIQSKNNPADICTKVILGGHK